MVFYTAPGDHDARLGAALRDALLRRSFSDVMLICGAANGESISAHRTVLALFSDFFAERIDKGYIMMPEDIQPGVLRTLVKFLYSGRAEISGPDELSEVSRVAERLKIDLFKEVTAEDVNGGSREPAAESVPAAAAAAVAAKRPLSVTPRVQRKASKRPRLKNSSASSMGPSVASGARGRVAMFKKLKDIKREPRSNSPEGTPDRMSPAARGCLTPPATPTFAKELAGSKKGRAAVPNMGSKTTLSCDFCPKKFPSGFGEAQLKTHHDSHRRGLEPHGCPVCKVIFFSAKAIRKHIAKAHPDQFEGGPNPARSPVQAQRHSGDEENNGDDAVANHNPTTTEQDGCDDQRGEDEDAANESGGSSSVAGSESDKFSCSKCPKTCMDPYGLRRHMELHKEGKKTRTCAICKVVCAKGAHTKHMKLAHPDLTKHRKGKGDGFKCFQCPKICDTKYRFDQHLALHENPQNTRPCEVCNIVFAAKRIREHMAIDHGDKKSPSAPTAQTRSKGNSETSNGGRPCGVCGSLFKTVAALKGHLKFKHPGANSSSYSCIRCSWTSSEAEAGEAASHRELHESGQDLRRCVGCDVDFAVEGGHYDEHRAGCGDAAAGAGPGSLLFCDICEEEFGGRSALDSHIRDVHCNGDGGGDDDPEASDSEVLSDEELEDGDGEIFITKKELVENSRLEPEQEEDGAEEDEATEGGLGGEDGGAGGDRDDNCPESILPDAANEEHGDPNAIM